MNLCGFEIGLDRPFFLIAGPCVIESMQLQLDTAGTLKEITSELGIPFIFKSSFDKANRTSGSAFHGFLGAGGCARGHHGPPEAAVGERDFRFERGIPPAIEDFACVDPGDRRHCVCRDEGTVRPGFRGSRRAWRLRRWP